MNKDHIDGAAEKVAGEAKENVGKALGDSKLETEGKADQVAGAVKTAVGDLKDAARK